MHNDSFSYSISLFRLTDGTEAGNLHKILTAKLTPIVAHLGSALDKAQLQKLCDGSRSHQGWTAAHLSAHASLQVGATLFWWYCW